MRKKTRKKKKKIKLKKKNKILKKYILLKKVFNNTNNYEMKTRKTKNENNDLKNHQNTI